MLLVLDYLELNVMSLAGLHACPVEGDCTDGF